MSRHVGQFLVPTVIPHARLRLSACVSAVGRASPVARIYEITWFSLPSFSWMPFLSTLDRRSPATNSPNLRPFLLAVSPPWNQPAGKGFSLSQRVPNCCLLLRRLNDLPAVWQRVYPCPGRRVLSLRLTAKMRESRMRTNAVWRPVEYETTACPLVQG